VNQRNQRHVLVLVIGCCSFLTIAGLNMLSSPPSSGAHSTFGTREAAPRISILPGTQISLGYSGSYARTNILELPAANPEFVGHWGGLVSNDDLSAAAPLQHVAIVFGRRGNTVYFASRLFSPAGQHVVSKPQVSMVSATEALVRYVSEDDESTYQYSHRFVLLASGKLGYREIVRVADRYSHQLLGIAVRRATLKRVTTPREFSFFAHPGPDDVREAEISLSRQCAHSSHQKALQ